MDIAARKAFQPTQAAVGRRFGELCDLASLRRASRRGEDSFRFCAHPGRRLLPGQARAGQIVILEAEDLLVLLELRLVEREPELRLLVLHRGGDGALEIGRLRRRLPAGGERRRLALLEALLAPRELQLGQQAQQLAMNPPQVLEMAGKKSR